MPKLTIEQLQTLEALTGKHHSILNGKPRKTLRTPSQSFNLGLMIRPTSITNNEERRVLVNIYETMFKYEVTDYNDSLKLELLENRYITELYDIGYEITFFDRNGNYKAEAITDGLISRLMQSVRKDYLNTHNHPYINYK